MNELKKTRSVIDEIDQKIIDLLRARKKLVLKISEIKNRERIDIRDSKRESEVMLKAENEYEKEILKKIISESRKLQL